MRRKVFIVWAVVLTMAATLECQPSAADQQRDFYEFQKEQAGSFQAEADAMEADWIRLENEQQASWNQLRKEAEQKWQDFIYSTRRDWVEYDVNRESRSKVDFKEGKIQIETVVSNETPTALEQAKQKIVALFKSIFSKTVGDSQVVLENQLVDKAGKAVTAKNLDKFIENEIIPGMIEESKNYKAGDGKERKKYSVVVPMVADHLNIRAREFAPLVTQYAERFQIEPALLMAVIHTESYFNPLAVSKAGAIGLMQVIPRYAGREAYQYLYAKDWLILPEYLHSPGINVELGSAYLHLLQSKYFNDIEGKLKNRYLTICAYNWGPGAVREKIVNGHRINSMTDAEVYALLRRTAPPETRDYLAKVTERMALYEKYFTSRGG